MYNFGMKSNLNTGNYLTYTYLPYMSLELVFADSGKSFDVRNVNTDLVPSCHSSGARTSSSSTLYPCEKHPLRD